MDGLLRKYGGEGLPLEERARLGLLPDVLTVGEIVTLWAAGDNGQELNLRAVMPAAMKRGGLKWLEPIQRARIEGGIHFAYVEAFEGERRRIQREDFKAWLEASGEPLPTFWFPAAPAADEYAPLRALTVCAGEPGRRAQQIEFVLQVIRELEYDPMCIPYRGKQNIKQRCLTKTTLFVSEEAFEGCWSDGNTLKSWAVENKARYSKGNSS